MKRRANILIWAGFVVAIAALVSYIPLFAQFPLTRDVPWVNLLLFFVAVCFLAAGLDRAYRKPDVYRGKISGTILGVLTLLMLGFFCFGVFYASKQIPESRDALRAGQRAETFALMNGNGKQVALADLLKNNRGALLIFYRGYW